MAPCGPGGERPEPRIDGECVGEVAEACGTLSGLGIAVPTDC